ncbi:LysR family transcriptional regulator [Paratissierella segnis]|jgi:DNA-binding transcriptional LysR family regulator|uniref:LysR family transcriptional regulator n=1 Tax=Paratissierella segnis TaxID=2763679 RepID=A0A926IJH4_9FIRM|nr:LysR family transcriptional regulator [Paratissierella segnis]MBC8587446.1 LysR family transcriptional regulator [Paratissierella segnis]
MNKNNTTTFTTLRYVVTVAEERSFTKAAEKLFVTQPTISQNIKALEDKLGTPLFDRSTYPLTLTYAGKLYIEWAQNTLLSQAQITKELTAIKNPEQTRLVIGSYAHRNTYIFPEIIEQLSYDYPHCNIVVEEGLPRVLYSGLEDGEIDIVIAEAYSDTVRYENIFIRNENLLIAAPKSFDIKRRASEDSNFPLIRLKDIEQHPVITLSPRHDFGNIIRTLFELENIVPNHVIECRRVELAHKFVERGLGITLLPEMYVEQLGQEDNIEYFIIDKYRPTRNISLIYSKNRFLIEPASRFIDLFLKKFATPETLPNINI